MINDVLEQLAEDYFRHLGYFTQHNVKYKPNLPGPTYAVHSDVDIVAINPKKKGIDKVIVASCKSWHGGIHIKRNIKQIMEGNKKIKKVYREISLPIWSNALKEKIKNLTGKNKFIFYIICTKFKLSDKDLWEKNLFFIKNLPNCPIKILDIKTMVEEMKESSKSITPAYSESARLMQMLHHSGCNLNYDE